MQRRAGGHRARRAQSLLQQGVRGERITSSLGRRLLRHNSRLGISKHRITNYFNTTEQPATIPASKRENFVSALRKRKTDHFIKLVESGNLPLRSGVETLVDEALASNVKVAVCSTSLERAVTPIVRTMLGSDPAKAMKIFAGDVVPKKKPHPAIYELGAATLNVRPERCVVIEDSSIGVAAAKAAGTARIVTTSLHRPRGFRHRRRCVSPHRRASTTTLQPRVCGKLATRERELIT